MMHLAAHRIDAIVPQLLDGRLPRRTPRWPSSPSRAGPRRSCCAARWPTSPSRCTTPIHHPTAVIIVGDVLAAEGFTDSYLYSAGPRPGQPALMRVAAARRHRRGAGRWPLGCTPAPTSSVPWPDGSPILRCRSARSASAASAVSRACGSGCATTDITAVVDATHPFAATMTAHAARACADLALPHLVLARPAWDPADAIVVGSDTEAADIVAAQRLFAGVPDHRAAPGLAPFPTATPGFSSGWSPRRIPRPAAAPSRGAAVPRAVRLRRRVHDADGTTASTCWSPRTAGER